MAIKTTKDGRWIYSGTDYTKLKRQKWFEQGERCADCGRRLDISFGQAHHVDGRGMGGSKRDDSKMVVLCIRCHSRYIGPYKVSL